jgi:hypothetical protein
MSFILPKRGAVSVKFKVTGLDQVDSGQEFYLLSGNLVFSGAPNPSTYEGIYNSGPQALFLLETLENKLKVEFRTDILNFKKVLELIAWFRDIDDRALLPEFCLLVTPYRRTIN